MEKKKFAKTTLHDSDNPGSSQSIWNEESRHGPAADHLQSKKKEQEVKPAITAVENSDQTHA